MYESGYDPSVASGSPFGLLIPIVLFIGLYFYYSFCMQKIAQKTGCSEHSWWAWVPILNAILLVECAGKPAWHFLFAFIPIVNFVFIGIWWMEIAKRCGRPAWNGLLAFIPVIGLFVPALCAFNSTPSYPTPPPAPSDKPRQPTSVG